MSYLETAGRIEAAFEVLRGFGVFAQANHTCCMSCGLYEIQEEEEEAYVFYHQQDGEDLKRTGVCHLAFGGDLDDMGEKFGPFICDTLRSVGLKVDWDGSEQTRIAVTELNKNGGNKV